MTEVSALVTLLMNVVDHNLKEGPSPSSVWVSINTPPVLKGGPYPDANEASFCIAKNLRFEEAEEMQVTLAQLLSNLGIMVGTELITDD